MSKGSVYVANGFDVPSGDVTYFGKDTSGDSYLRFEKSSKSIQIGNNITYPYMSIHDGSLHRIAIGDMNYD